MPKSGIFDAVSQHLLAWHISMTVLFLWHISTSHSGIAERHNVTRLTWPLTRRGGGENERVETVPTPPCRQCMVSVGANAHEQPKWLRRLSWCSYCLRIAACSCRVSTRVICATGHAPVHPSMLASWWVPLLPDTRRIGLPAVHCMQWMMQS